MRYRTDCFASCPASATIAASALPQGSGGLSTKHLRPTQQARHTHPINAAAIRPRPAGRVTHRRSITNMRPSHQRNGRITTAGHLPLRKSNPTLDPSDVRSGTGPGHPRHRQAIQRNRRPRGPPMKTWVRYSTAVYMGLVLAGSLSDGRPSAATGSQSAPASPPTLSPSVPRHDAPAAPRLPSKPISLGTWQPAGTCPNAASGWRSH